MQEKIQGYCLHSQPHGRNEERLKGRSIYPWLRVTFFKLKEGVGEHVKDEVLGAIRGIQRKFQFTCGGNFSPARAKGFFIASLEVFPGLNEPWGARELSEEWEDQGASRECDGAWLCGTIIIQSALSILIRRLFSCNNNQFLYENLSHLLYYIE